jgi:hypothetical protein
VSWRNQKEGCTAADAKSANALMGTLQENMLYSQMLTTYAANALQPLFYTYAASVVIVTVFVLTLAYTLRDILGGIVLAAIVYYLYTM